MHKPVEWALSRSRVASLWLVVTHVMLLLVMLLIPWPISLAMLALVPYLWWRHLGLACQGLVTVDDAGWSFGQTQPWQLKRIDCQPWGVRLHFKGGLGLRQRFLWRDQFSAPDWSRICAFAVSQRWH